MFQETSGHRFTSQGWNTAEPTRTGVGLPSPQVIPGWVRELKAAVREANR